MVRILNNQFVFTPILENNIQISFLNLIQQYPRNINKIKKKMKKYVSKEDVEKGLVDPNKPLNEQKDYLDKIEKEDRQKHPKDRDTGKPEYRRKREHRENRPKYNWNRRDVTQETVIPEAPKKEVPKPDKDKFFEKLNAMKKQIEDLNKKKTDLIEEYKSTMRNTSDSKKTTRNVKSKYSTLLNQKHSIKKALQEEMKLLEERRDELDKELNGVKEKINSLRKPDSFDDCSSEQLQKRLEKTEQKLTTAELTKKQQNQINMRISEIKRALQKSKSDVEINAEVGKLQDQNDLLYKQFKEVKATISEKYGQLKEVKGEIAQLNEELNQEKVEPEDTRAPEQIKSDFDKKIEEVNAQKQKIKKQIDQFREAHDKSLDEYEDYNDLISYIKMIKEEKEKIKVWKAEQERIKKEKEEAEKKRQQEYEERQKRREEKIKRDEERRKQVQERKEKLQKEREEFINKNPHHQKIDICKALVQYCESLKPENAQRRLEKREEKVVQPILELKPTDSKDWQKQLKKGAQVIVSKKLRDDEQAPKKVVKDKKKKQKEPTESTSGFTHHIDTAKMFQKVNLLPPLTAAQIDQTIKQILERIELFNKPTEQQIKAYKQKAEKQFDNLHGFDQERGPRKGAQNYRERGHDEHREHREHRERSGEHEEKQKEREKEKDKGRYKKGEKAEIVTTDKDFPGLN